MSYSSLSFTFFVLFLKKGRYSGFYLFYVNIWHVLGRMIHEELGFQTHSSVAVRVPFKYFTLNKNTSSLLWKRCLGFVFKGKKVQNKTEKSS